MKHLTISLLTLHSALCALSASAALPVKWDVDLAAQPPQVFSLQRPRGETYELEAVLKDHGKPFAPSITNASIYWQTNGMENLYWSAPASVSNNVLRAMWLPSMDPGSTTVRGYIGDPGHIYAAAFQFRFIASPGATPNELPLPQKVIDFAKVTVLNPPWSGGGGGGGVDTNAVRVIVRPMIGEATNGLRRVDDMAVYEYGNWTITVESTTGEWCEDIIPPSWNGSAWVSIGTYGTDPDPISNDSAAAELRFTCVRPLETATVIARRVMEETSDRLATTKGVNAAIAEHHDGTKLDRTGGTVTGDLILRRDYALSSPSVSFRGENPSLNSSVGVAIATTHDGQVGGLVLSSLGGVLVEHGDTAFDLVTEVPKKRDLTDNKCRKTEFGEWVHGELPSADIHLDSQPEFDDEYAHAWVWYDHVENIDWIARGSTMDSASATFVVNTGKPDAPRFTATRSAVCTSNETLVTSSYVTNAVEAAKYVPSATDLTFSNAVLAVQIDTNTVAQIGELKQFFDDLPTGTVGTSLGGIILALLGAAAYLKKKTALLKSDGTAEDDFATDLFGKQVAKEAITASLADPFVAKTSGSYAEGDPVTYDGKLYKRNSTTGDDTSWVSAHWAETTVANLWNNADTTSYGGQS